MQQTKDRGPIFWSIILVIVFIVGMLSSVYVGLVAAKNMKGRLLERTTTIAHLIPSTTITSLAGDNSDLQNPVYQKLKSSLKDAQDTNRDIRFIYILAQDENKEAFFYVDSVDPSNEEDYSPPGQLYPEGSEDVSAMYESKTGAVLPITSDRWGSWLSAFSPIMDNNGTVVGIVGLDVPASYFYKTVAANAAIPLLITLLALSVLLWIRHHLGSQQRYLSEKAFFLSFAGHEIRSPLTAVAATLHTLPENSAKQPVIKKVSDSLRHILDLLDDVLALQATEGLKNQGVNKKSVKISEHITNCVESLQLLAEQRKTVIKDVSSKENKELTVKIDPLLFERVISNFLVNAIKYSPDHSVVEVEVSHSKKKWHIRFHNEGVPIPKIEQKKLLQGFYRTREARKSGQKGTGLGMILARDIINQHKGQLSLDSGPNRGVTFTITLPR